MYYKDNQARMTGQSLVKNTAYITAASIGQKLISFAYFTIIARFIGPAGTGKYFFALSFTTIAVVFVDLGFTNVLIREVAKERSRAQAYLSTVLWIKVILGALSYAGAALAINWLGYPYEIKQLVYVSGVTMLFDSLHLALYGVLRGLGDLRYESVSLILSQLLSLILGSLFLLFRLPLVFLMLAFAIPSFLNTIFVGSVLYRRHGLRLYPRYEQSAFRYLVAVVWPFALAAVFARVYGYIDTILLSRLAGDVAVGWYSVPYKITFAFQFIPLSLNAALYPRLSEYYIRNKEKLARVFEQSAVYLLAWSAPIALGICALAKPIILTVYTAAYQPSVAPLQILVLSLIFSFLSFPIGALLNACDRQNTQLSIVGAVMVINIILNLILIPRYSVMGAAIAAFIGNTLLAVAGYGFARKIVQLPARAFNIGLRILFSAFVMYIAARYFASFSLWWAIVLAAAVYSAMLFVTGVIKPGEWRKFFSFEMTK